MRTYFHGEVLTRSGLDKRERLIYASHKNDTICIKKTWYEGMIKSPHLVPYAQKLKQAVNLWKILNNTFIEDLKIYARAYNSQINPSDKLDTSAYNIWIKALCSKPTSFNSLLQVETTLGETIADWIDSDHLPNVRTSHTFSAPVNP